MEKHDLKLYFKEIFKVGKLKIIVVLALMLGVAACNLIRPQMIKVIIDQAIPQKILSLLFYAAVGYAFFSIVSDVFSIIQTYLYSVMKRAISIRYKNKLLKHLCKMHGGYWGGKRTGEILKVLEDDVYNVENFGIETIFMFLSQVITAIIAAMLLATMQPTILIIVIVIEVLEIVLQIQLTKLIAKRTAEARDISGDVFSVLNEFVGNLTGIIIAKCQRPFWKKLITFERAFRNKSIRLDVTYEASAMLSNLLHTTIVLAIYVIGGYWAIKGNMTLGTLVIYIEYVNMLTGPIYNMIRLNSQVQQTKVSLSKIYEILNEKPQIKQNNGGDRESEFKSIQFKKVGFSYDGRNDTLKGLDLKLHTGTVTGIVGNTGCGKSTVIKLLYRLWDITKGEILIDEKPIHTYNLKYLRSQIAVISQDVLIFNDTIWKNIVCESKLSKEEILKICRLTGVEEFVLNMNEAYNTKVGERGALLSGGQKQKIAIARALASGGRVLVLDEATASVDNVSQSQIMNNIREYLRNKIVIIIAHRLITVKDADEICVMKDGCCVGNGSHGELIKNCAEYSELLLAGNNVRE